MIRTARPWEPLRVWVWRLGLGLLVGGWLVAGLGGLLLSQACQLAGGCKLMTEIQFQDARDQAAGYGHSVGQGSVNCKGEKV